MNDDSMEEIHDPIFWKGYNVIQPIEESPLGGDIHENFRVDDEGNISNGHLTMRAPDGVEIQILWEE